SMERYCCSNVASVAGMASSRRSEVACSASDGRCSIQWCPPVSDRCGDHLQGKASSRVSPDTALSLTPAAVFTCGHWTTLGHRLRSHYSVWQQPLCGCTVSNCVRQSWVESI